jgi:hypothetical protein
MPKQKIQVSVRYISNILIQSFLLLNSILEAKRGTIELALAYSLLAHKQSSTTTKAFSHKQVAC